MVLVTKVVPVTKVVLVTKVVPVTKVVLVTKVVPCVQYTSVMIGNLIALHLGWLDLFEQVIYCGANLYCRYKFCDRY